MTLRVTIAHSSQGVPKDALVTHSAEHSATRVSEGQTVEFDVAPGDQVTIVEIDALPSSVADRQRSD